MANCSIRDEIHKYINEGHINKDKIIVELLDFLSEDEVTDFAKMYHYFDDEELSESVADFTNKEMRIISDTVNKFYPEYNGKYTATFLNDVVRDKLPKNCYVDLDDAREGNLVSEADIDDMIVIDEYCVGGSDNVTIVSMLSPHAGKIYRYADI